MEGSQSTSYGIFLVKGRCEINSSYLSEIWFIPILGILFFSVLSLFELKSRLGILSPSGICSVFSLVKFIVEGILCSYPNELIKTGNDYGIFDEEIIGLSFLLSFLVSFLTYIVLFIGTYKTRLYYAADFDNLKCNKGFHIKEVPSTFSRIKTKTLKAVVLFFVGFFGIFLVISINGGLNHFFSNLGCGIRC